MPLLSDFAWVVQLERVFALELISLRSKMAIKGKKE